MKPGSFRYPRKIPLVVPVGKQVVSPPFVLEGGCPGNGSEAIPRALAETCEEVNRLSKPTLMAGRPIGAKVICPTSGPTGDASLVLGVSLTAPLSAHDPLLAELNDLRRRHEALMRAYATLEESHRSLCRLLRATCTGLLDTIDVYDPEPVLTALAAVSAGEP